MLTLSMDLDAVPRQAVLSSASDVHLKVGDGVLPTSGEIGNHVKFQGAIYTVTDYVTDTTRRCEAR